MIMIMNLIFYIFFNLKNPPKLKDLEREKREFWPKKTRIHMLFWDNKMANFLAVSMNISSKRPRGRLNGLHSGKI